MLATLILGILAGALAPRAVPHVKRALEGIALADVPLTEDELRQVSFAASLVAAAVLALIFGSDSMLALTVGAVAGVFAPRVVDRLQARSRPSDEED